MRKLVLCLTGAFFLLAASPASADDSAAAKGDIWSVGFGTACITPEIPVRMYGYASRVEPSKGVEADIFVKAMAIEDADGAKAVLVTMDLGPLGPFLTDPVLEEVADPMGIPRDRFLFTCSHSHSGPDVGLETDRPGMGAEHAEALVRYTRHVREQLVAAVRDALEDMAPARLSWGTGVAPFVMNRREFTPRGVILGVNPRGLADRSVPVLRVENLDGELRGVVFGCACHNTTLTGNNYRIGGDYAGFAQSYIEAEHPGAHAMFVAGCGGDANPYPRSGEQAWDHARNHGRTLGAEVRRVLDGPMQPVRGPLRIARDVAPLPFETRPSREDLETVATGRQKGAATNAKAVLAMLDRGEELPTHQEAPLSVWQFGDDLTLVALSGEVVVDYVPRIETSIGPLRLWVAAYSYEVFGYVTSARVQSEGGYEAKGIQGRGLLALDTERVYVDKVHELARKVGRTTPEVETR